MMLSLYNEDVQIFKNVASDTGFKNIKWTLSQSKNDPRFTEIYFELDYPEQINRLLLLILFTGKRIAYKQLDAV